MTPEKMEKKQRAKIVDTALGYLGVKQGSTKHKHLINVFNTVKPDGWAMTYTAYWCAATVSAWAIETFGKDKAKEFFPLSGNCETIITLAKKMKIWKEADDYKPKAGDWLLYDWQDTGKGDDKGGPDHVGLVEKVKDGKITVIEGNYHKAVQRRVIPVNGKYIRGFVLPKYDKIVKHSTRWYLLKTTDQIVTYMNKHHFKYVASYTDCALTWDGAKKKKTTNCSTCICYALQEAEFLEPGQYFWVKGEKFNFRGKGTKKQLLKVADITHPNKTAAKAGLKKGDICCYDNGHMMEFAGFDSKNRPTWYTYGPSDVGDKQPKVRASYTDRKITTRIRVKEGAKK